MKKILVVEDDIHTLNALQMVLSENNYEVLTAESYDSGLSAILNNRDTDLALLDIRMQEENEGIKLGEKIRELEKTGFNKIGIFFITITKDRDNVENAINLCQADAFIDKPFDNNDLLKKIKEYFEDRQKNDSVIRAFEEWISKIDPDDFKIEMSKEDGDIVELNGLDILEEMKKDSEFGRNFKQSIINVTNEILLNSLNSK